jgi:hypothetical protein
MAIAGSKGAGAREMGRWGEFKIQKLSIQNSKILNSRPSAADVRADILTQLLGKIGQGSKPQPHQLVVNRIEVAEGGDVEGASPQVDLPLEGTTARNQATD